jgi:hypothetical protein
MVAKKPTTHTLHTHPHITHYIHTHTLHTRTSCALRSGQFPSIKRLARIHHAFLALRIALRRIAQEHKKKVSEEGGALITTHMHSHALNMHSLYTPLYSLYTHRRLIGWGGTKRRWRSTRSSCSRLPGEWVPVIIGLDIYMAANTN